MRNINMNTILKPKAIIPKLVNVKNGTPSINKSCKET
jgi:hypothetical protein